MKQNRIRSIFGLAGAWHIGVLLLAVVSLSLAGFAHRAMPLDAVQPGQTAFQLPDGTALSICLTGGTSDHEEHDGHCDFCRIASASHAIDGAPQLARIMEPQTIAALRFSSSASSSLRWRANSARAPPAAA